ncbi:hypothetical protein NL676_021434 [Syzygium grande]|nr:hypothetical protein NL676_021434 [Syzygium grande]
MDKEKVREAVLAHYEGLAEDKKQMARRLFKAMDTDKSGNASIDEFIAFCSYIALQSDNHYWLFAQLELVTFFYILSHDEYKNLLNSQPRGASKSPPPPRVMGKAKSTEWQAWPTR